jgi:hypothetical protein
MAPSESTPQRSGLPSRWHVLLHILAIVVGWGIFAWSWWLVSGQPRATDDLRNLIAGATILMPILTTVWIAHNVGIYRRKGPRRASAPVPLRYEVDFNGRRIVADWPALQRARIVVIERGDGFKRFVSGPQPKPVSDPVTERTTERLPEPKPAATQRARPGRDAEHRDFATTES